jgi:DNA-binding GntR family transcriptional regulator
MVLTQPLSRLSLSHQIRDRLLDRIMNGSLKPGDRLIELKIAKEMATSQAPVREALRELETMGVIEAHRNKGARVRVITNEELRQIYDVRAQFEAYACQVVAETEVDIEAALNSAIFQMKNAAQNKNSLGFAEHNMEFHRIIIKATRNDVLLDLWESLNVRMRTMVNVSRSRKNLLELSQSHVPMVAALVSGDPDIAFQTARDHVLKNKPGEDYDEQ